MGIRQRDRKGSVDSTVGAGDRLGTGALDDIQRRNDDVAMAKSVQHRSGQHEALVRLQGQFGRALHGLSIVRQAERLQPRVGTQFEQMFAPGLLSQRIPWPARQVRAELLPDSLQQMSGHVDVGQQALPRIAQKTQLHRDAESIWIAPDPTVPLRLRPHAGESMTGQLR